MSTLSSIGREARQLADPLPVNNSFLNAHVTFRKGQFSLLAAAPGVGKTIFAMNLALFTGADCLYFSADSDEHTVLTRSCAAITHTPSELIVAQLEEDAWGTYYSNKLSAADHIDWCYRTDIDTDFIVYRLQAHEEVWGKYPDLIVVDNLGNTVTDQENEYAELRGICRELQRIARNTDAHVMGLHHVNGPKEDGFEAITLKDLQGKVGKIPEIVLGLSRDSQESVLLTVPKNRAGRSGLKLPLPLNYETARVGGYS